MTRALRGTDLSLNMVGLYSGFFNSRTPQRICLKVSGPEDVHFPQCKLDVYDAALGEAEATLHGLPFEVLLHTTAKTSAELLEGPRLLVHHLLRENFIFTFNMFLIEIKLYYFLP